MGMAPVAHVLFNKFMSFNPKNPKWLNRDRFVLSYVFPGTLLLLLGPFSDRSAETVTDACFSIRSCTCSATMFPWMTSSTSE